jgi:hypothetical protein
MATFTTRDLLTQPPLTLQLQSRNTLVELRTIRIWRVYEGAYARGR